MKPEKKVSGRLLIDLPEKLTYDIDTVVVVEVEDEVPRVGEYNK
jgi:hypothetical protein